MSRIANPAPGFAKNPDRVVAVEPYRGTVTVRAGGNTIASSSRALTLSEPPYPPVLYIPFADIDFSKLEKSGHSTHCPYKGEASYWNVALAGAAGQNAMWGYEAPYDEMAAIKDHAAFYPDKVSVETG